MKKLLSNLIGHLAPQWMWRRRARAWTEGPVEEEIRFLASVCDSNKTSVDVGASMGLYTLHLLGYSREVWSFEPRQMHAQKLRETFSEPWPRCHVECVALSDQHGTAEMRIVDSDLGRRTIEAKNPLEASGFEFHYETVPVKTLDEYNLTDVGFIKIDVEGHEEAVLRGARNTFRNSQPVLLLEMEERHNPVTSNCLTAMMKELGYHGYYLNEGRFEPIETIDTLNPVLANGRYVQNFFFFTASHMGRLGARSQNWTLEGDQASDCSFSRLNRMSNCSFICAGRGCSGASF